MTNRLQLMGNDAQAALAASLGTGIVVLQFLIFGNDWQGSLLVVGPPDQLCNYPEDQDLSYLLDCCAPYWLSAMLYVMFLKAISANHSQAANRAKPSERG